MLNYDKSAFSCDREKLQMTLTAVKVFKDGEELSKAMAHSFHSSKCISCMTEKLSEHEMKVTLTYQLADEAEFERATKEAQTQLIVGKLQTLVGFDDEEDDADDFGEMILANKEKVIEFLQTI